jgi:hypothetical protein
MAADAEKTLERWAKGGFTEEAGRFILDHAGYSFPPLNQYPETPIRPAAPPALEWKDHGGR